MPTTRRRKIARRSVAIRRVKPNAKRKTYRRKSRNIVMKGGVHKSLKVYVIQERLEGPKCVIIKSENKIGKDDIYLFFDTHLDQAEIKEFVCAAMGLESTAHIEPALAIEQYSEGEDLKNLFIRLRGFKSYSMESGLLSNSETISEGSFTKHTISGTVPKMEKWEDVIEKLKEKSKAKDYTFTPFVADFLMKNPNKITKGELVSLFRHITKETTSEIEQKCETDGIMNDVQALRRMIERQSNLVLYIKQQAIGFTTSIKDRNDREQHIRDKESHKNATIETLKRNNPKWDDEISQMRDLIEKINSSGCKRFISEDSRVARYLVMYYLEGEKQFKSIEEIVNETYDEYYQNWLLTPP